MSRRRSLFDNAVELAATVLSSAEHGDEDGLKWTDILSL